MYELIQVAENTFYMDCPAKVGFFRTGEKEVVAIDSGSDKDAGKKVKRILEAQGWNLKAIYNTHTHADHTGGNAYLQAQTGCRIYAPKTEIAMLADPVFEPAFLYGAYPMKDLCNKFLMAKESLGEELKEETLPEGLELLPLPGHSYNMVGFRTKDNVLFLADSLAGEETVEKYQISFLYDVKAYLETLEKIKTLQADCFLPSHAEPTKDIVPLAQKNIDKTLELAAKIESLLSSPKTFDDLLADIFNIFGLQMNLTQRMLVGSTAKSYLSYLKNSGRVEILFEENRMLWKKA